MKLRIYILIIVSLCSLSLMAQSMTDDQVMRTVIKEHEQGSSNSQIVTKLMQSGVNIQQIRRVKKQMEILQNQSALSKDNLSTTNVNRSRKNNGKTRTDYGKG